MTSVRRLQQQLQLHRHEKCIGTVDDGVDDRLGCHARACGVGLLTWYGMAGAAGRWCLNVDPCHLSSRLAFFVYQGCRSGVEDDTDNNR